MNGRDCSRETCNKYYQMEPEKIIVTFDLFVAYRPGTHVEFGLTNYYQYNHTTMWADA